MKDIILYLEETNTRQISFLLFLLPIACFFALYVYRLESLFIELFVGSDLIGKYGDTSDFVLIKFLAFAILHGVLCEKIAQRKGWYMLGFLLSGVAIFYAMVIRHMKKNYPDKQGILFCGFSHEVNTKLEKINFIFFFICLWSVAVYIIISFVFFPSSRL